MVSNPLISNSGQSPTRDNKLSLQSLTPQNDGRRITPRNGPGHSYPLHPPQQTTSNPANKSSQQNFSTRGITSLPRQSIYGDNRVPIIINRIQTSSMPHLTDAIPSTIPINQAVSFTSENLIPTPVKMVSEQSPVPKASMNVQAFPVTQVTQMRSNPGYVDRHVSHAHLKSETAFARGNQRFDNASPHVTSKNDTHCVRYDINNSAVSLQSYPGVNVQSCQLINTQASNVKQPLSSDKRVSVGRSDDLVDDTDSSTQTFVTPSTSMSTTLTSKPFHFSDDVTSESRVRRLQQLVSMQSLNFKPSNSQIDEVDPQPSQANNNQDNSDYSPKRVFKSDQTNS